MRVGKDRESWQELECFLFAEMLICVKEKRINDHRHPDDPAKRTTRTTLKGSILIKRHLRGTEASPGKFDTFSPNSLRPMAEANQSVQRNRCWPCICP